MRTLPKEKADGDGMSLWKLAMFYGDGMLLWMSVAFYEGGMRLWKLAVLMGTACLYEGLLCFKDEAFHDSVWGQKVVIDHIIIWLQQLKTISFMLIRKNYWKIYYFKKF